MQVSHTVSAVFDDRNLIGYAGLVPVLQLARRAGLQDLLGARLTVRSPNPVSKSTCVVAGMLCGADSIDDLDVIRHGGMGRVFDDVRAPSTLGTFLRSFTFGHVRQLDAVNSRLLTGLAGLVPGLLAGGDQMTYVDVDDTIREVHGYAKQGAAYGYSGLKGLNAQLAVVSTPTAAPVIAAARLRKGNVKSGHGAGRLVGDALRTARGCGASGPVLVRADSGYYQHATIAAAVKHGSWFSVTARQDRKVRAAIAAVDDRSWTAIKYPRAVFDEQAGAWISDAEVAETPYVAFTSRRKKQHVACRLVVRRVRALNPQQQGEELFPVWRYHAFVTNSTLPTVDADRTHRAHAIVEQVIAELKDGPMAHAPSALFTANAAWLAHAVTAFNLTRAAGVIASRRHAVARCATLRRRLIAVPGRIATSARRVTLHLPAAWPWAASINNLFDATAGPPRPATA
jgi:hypothetical protein